MQDVQEEPLVDNGPVKKSMALDITSVAGPLVTNFTVGGVSGYCAGVAVKKVSKAAATVIGGSFIALQLLAYNGYVTVHWDKIEQDVISLVDKDGDGKPDMAAVQEKLSKVLSYQLPSSFTGFGVGFGLAIKYS